MYFDRKCPSLFVPDASPFGPFWCFVKIAMERARQIERERERDREREREREKKKERNKQKMKKGFSKRGISVKHFDVDKSPFFTSVMGGTRFSIKGRGPNGVMHQPLCVLFLSCHYPVQLGLRQLGLPVPNWRPPQVTFLS